MISYLNLLGLALVEPHPSGIQPYIQHWPLPKPIPMVDLIRTFRRMSIEPFPLVIQDDTHYTVYGPLSPFGPLRLQVLDTDYETYASVYGCFTLLGKIRLENGYVYTRERNPPDVVVRSHGVQ